MSKKFRLFSGLLLASTLLLAASSSPENACPVSPKLRGHENIEWSIGYAFHLTDRNQHLPRALLIGDSICNAYQGGVCRLAEGKMNISYWVSSYCVSSPGYLRLLGFYLDETKYDVVHFNNGLHSLGSDPAAYEQGLRAALKLIREKQPQARIIWATSTPLKDPAKTATARKLNAIAAKVVAEFGNIATDDLFSLLDPFDRNQNWSDCYHHKAPLVQREAAAVFQALQKK